MDPATAFGVAVNVAQVIDVSIKIIGLCQAFYRAQGELPDDFARIQTLVGDLLALMQRLQQQAQTSTGNPSVINEPTFQALIDGCLIEIKNLHDKLNSLQTPGGRFDPLNLRTSFRALRESGKITKTASVLQQYRDAISARLIQSTHEKQQYVCEVVDRNRTEFSQASRAMQDTLDLLQSSITNTSRTIATDVNALVVHGDESRLSIERLLQEVRMIGDEVEGLRRTMQASFRPQQQIRSPSVLQLQSARYRRRVRIRSSSDQTQLGHVSSRHHPTQSREEKSQDDGRRPLINLPIFVNIFGEPLDLVSLVRSMFFSSWTNVIRPVRALLSSNTIPPTLKITAPVELDFFSSMLQQPVGKVEANYDATTGVITVSNGRKRIMIRMQSGAANPITSQPFRKDALWNLFHGLPRLNSASIEDSDTHVPRRQSTEFLEYPPTHDHSNSYLLFTDASDGSSSSSPKDTAEQTIETPCRQISSEQTGDDQVATAEAPEIDFSTPPTALPIIKDSSIYAGELLTGKQRCKCSHSFPSSSSRTKSRSRKRHKLPSCGTIFFCLFFPCCFLVLAGFFIEKVDDGWTFKYFSNPPQSAIGATLTLTRVGYVIPKERWRKKYVQR